MTTVVDAITGQKKEEDTEWGEWQRRLGNFAPRPKQMSSDRAYKIRQNQLEATLSSNLSSELNLEAATEALERIDGDVDLQPASSSDRHVAGPGEGPDADLDAELAAIRARRLAEMRKQADRDRFGSLTQIRKVDFVAEVNKASCEVLAEGDNNDGGRTFAQILEAEEAGGSASSTAPRAAKNRDGPEGEAAFLAGECQRNVPANRKCVWVVVLLTGAVDSSSRVLQEVVEKSVTRLAAKFRSVKFVQGSAEEMMPGFPSQVLPALFLYNRGVCRKQLFLRSCLPASCLSCQVEGERTAAGSARSECETATARNAEPVVSATRMMEWLLFENFVLESVVARGGGSLQTDAEGCVESAVGRVQAKNPFSAISSSGSATSRARHETVKNDRCYMNKALQTRSDWAEKIERG